MKDQMSVLKGSDESMMILRHWLPFTKKGKTGGKAGPVQENCFSCFLVGGRGWVHNLRCPANMQVKSIHQVGITIWSCG